MKTLLLFLFSFLALSFGQDAKVVQAADGFLSATVDGRGLESAWGFWYDRSTTKTYTPDGKPTPFTFEPARFVMSTPEAVFAFLAGNAPPATVTVTPISPPFAFATDETAKAVVTVLRSWCPEFDYELGEDNFTNTAGWRREPKNSRVVNVTRGYVKYGSINAGLMANTIMRNPGNGARLQVRSECESWRPSN